jgi:uncharacterized repeat protein (TIGR01451 family)
MIVWGGHNDGSRLSSGGRYCASGILGLDFGDAPDPTYPTLLASDGARHQLLGTLFLGAAVDAEPDGRPSSGADGDDLDAGDDEDGVSLPASMVAGATETLQVSASAAGLLSTWVDLDADGDWLDPGEQVLTDEPLAAGTNDVDVLIPAGAVSGTTVARFRLDSGGGLGPDGLAADGEVEDYTLVIDASAEVSVSVADLPDPVPEGGRLAYAVQVTNNGTLDATGVVLSDTLPAEAAFVDASAGCAHAGGVVTCDLGTVAPEAEAQVDVEVDVAFGVSGEITSTAEVTLDQADPAPANNSDQEGTTVLRCDVDGSGVCDAADGAWIVSCADDEVGCGCPGDPDLDGDSAVNGADLDHLVSLLY